METTGQFKIYRTTLRINVSELCKLGYTDDPNPTYEWQTVAGMNKKEKIGAKIADNMTDEELLNHFQKFPIKWGYY